MVTGIPAGRSGQPPSGLFGKAAFELDVTTRTVRRPPWWGDPVQRDRRYAAWVQAEAAGLVAQLGRLERPGIDDPAQRHVRGLMRLLEQDAAWAGARLARTPACAA